MRKINKKSEFNKRATNDQPVDLIEYIKNNHLKYGQTAETEIDSKNDLDYHDWWFKYYKSVKFKKIQKRELKKFEEVQYNELSTEVSPVSTPTKCCISRRLKKYKKVIIRQDMISFNLIEP